MKCPGQDIQFWKPDDIYEVDCPNCRAKVEFWKNEPYRRCKKCGHNFRNPKLDLGCAEWCEYAKYCLGQDIKALSEKPPPGISPSGPDEPTAKNKDKK
ncbi:MAG: hypothetical protein AAB019_04800 [Planctomycetota bacterium]